MAGPQNHHDAKGDARGLSLSTQEAMVSVKAFVKASYDYIIDHSKDEK